MKVGLLTEELAGERAADLVSIEEETLASHGASYAEDRWGTREFLFPLPHKWTTSTCVLRSDGSLAGFWIASCATAGIAHAHRVALSGTARHRGLYRAMGEAWLLAASRIGAREFSAFVTAGNFAAARFYIEHGFMALDGAPLLDLLRRTGREATVRGDVVLGPSGHEKHLWYRDDRK